MPITLNRKVRFSHFDFTYTGNNYTEYLYGSIGLKVNANIVCEVEWLSKDISIILTTTDKTIVRQDSGSFWLDGFNIGDTITIVNTVSNNISTTITDISDNGNIMTVAGLSLTETANSATIHGITSVVAIDFYPNLIDNSKPFSLDNLTDRETQPRYSADTVSTDSANPTVMIRTTNSQGWVSPHDRATIYQSSTANYIQTYVISHTFTILPLFLPNQLTKLQHHLAPAAGAFKDKSCLKYVYVIDAKFSAYDPNPPHTSNGYITFPNGQTGWYNEFINGRPAVWIKESIAYTDNATGASLPAVDYCKVVDVVAKLTCQNLVDNANITVQVVYLPMDESQYINTLTNYATNYVYERALCTVSGATIQGENTGDYHFLKNVVATSPSINHVTVNFQIDYSQTVIDLFNSYSADNRNYLIFITAQSSL